MSQTYKEGQIEALFDPKTPDDHAVVLILKAMDILGRAHKDDKQYELGHGLLAGLATGLAMNEESTFDGAFVDELTDRMGKEAGYDPGAPESGG